jgi:hypothetical protein
MTVTPLKPETGEGYVIKIRGASKKLPADFATQYSYIAMQYK